MKYKGYFGEVTYDDEAKLFHGEVIGLKDVITFQGQSVDELISLPGNKMLLALESVGYNYPIPNSNTRLTLIQMDTFGGIDWKRIYVPSNVIYVAQNVPNSVALSITGELMICGFADQGDNAKGNYLFKTDNVGRVMGGNMYKYDNNTGMSSLSRTITNDFIVTQNGAGIMRFKKSLTCAVKKVPLSSYPDTTTTTQPENAVKQTITDISTVLTPTKYVVPEAPKTVCGNKVTCICIY